MTYKLFRLFSTGCGKLAESNRIDALELVKMVSRMNKVLLRFRNMNLVMAGQTALHKVHRIRGYRQRRMRERLYRQWVDHADLPTLAIRPSDD